MKSGITRYTLGAFNQSAMDDVYNKAKELYVSDEILPPSSGINPATTDIIWSDSMDVQGADDVNPSGLSKDYGQYGTPYQKRSKIMSGVIRTTAWNMFSEMGQQDVSCALSINQADNTVVEVGLKRTWLWRTDNTWIQIEEKDFLNGVHYPTPNDNVPTELGCTEPFRSDRAANLDYTCREGYSADGWGLYRPRHSWWFHGYSDQINVSNVKAIFTQQYARLQLLDPNGEDDRHLAKYTFLMAVDDYSNSTYNGDIGMGKRKLVTNTWNSFNFLAMGNNADTITKQEFIDSNPPFSLVP